MGNKTIFAFDFSMAKPAMCSWHNNKINFWCFPMNMDEKTFDMLSACNIKITNRNLQPINKKNYDSHTLVMEHINRANNLSNIILETILSFINKHNINKDNVIIASEGLSYASKGDAALDLSGYKYTLLTKLLSNGFNVIKTYSPITIKNIAGCGKKSEYGKFAMIQKITEENTSLHPFIDTLKNDSQNLKKKTAFINCVDDLVDAYWCLKTTIIKENLNIEL